MVFAEIRHEPELVLSRICDGQCTYANVAAMAFLVGNRQEEAGGTAIADRLFAMLEPLHAGTMTHDDICQALDSLFLADGCHDSATRAMFSYALDVDMLTAGRLMDLSLERRRQFVQMTCDIARQGMFAPRTLTEHFLDPKLMPD